MVTIDLYGKQINVNTYNLNLKQIRNQLKQEEAENLAKQGVLPNIGTIFLLKGQLFKIVYINQGRKRISAIWYDDKTQSFNGLPDISSECSIYGKIYKVTFHNELKKRITMELVN